MNSLMGKRILIAEDNFLIGAMVSDTLAGAGAEIVGPACTQDMAVSLARTEALEAAVLDVNLRGQFSDVVAAELRSRSIPFIVATGYGKHPQRNWGEQAVLTKPFTEQPLLESLRQVFEHE